MRRIENIIGRRDPMTLTASDLMEDTLVTCTPKTPVASIAMRLCDGNFGSLPVVDDQHTLLGLVSEFDLLNAIKAQKDLRKVPAAEIMTKDILTATEDLAIMDLITRMQEHHLIRLPVVRGYRLVGVVARRDIIYGYMLASFRHEGGL